MGDVSGRPNSIFKGSVMDKVQSRNVRAFLFLVLPLAAAYFASYFFRTINALISSELTNDLQLNARHLGLLTSVYFLTFAFVQIPAGVLLDRYGPRRVQSVLLVIAAVGACTFAVAQNFTFLVIGRALIGLGVAASLIAGLKAIALWFPKERLALINGCYITIGTLGVVAATAPSELILHFVDWRVLFGVLALLCVVCAGLVFTLLPDNSSHIRSVNAGSIRLKAIYMDPRFWRLAPLSMMCISTSWALQGLWAGPWFSDVDRLDHASVVHRLFAMAIALSFAALLLGAIADKLRRLGVRPHTILATTAVLFIGMQLALILKLPMPSVVIWSVIAGTGAATVISYSILAEYFPKEISGQANSALNTFHIGGAFIIQAGIGMIVGHWTGEVGHYPAIAYKIAIGANLVLQVLALAWFVAPRTLIAQGRPRASTRSLAAGRLAAGPQRTAMTNEHRQ
jgi:MFS family permease